MHRPRTGSVAFPLLVSLALACLCAALAPLAYAQVCGSSDQTSWMAGKTRDADGLMHVKVKYDAGSQAPNADMRSLRAQDASAIIGTVGRSACGHAWGKA